MSKCGYLEDIDYSKIDEACIDPVLYFNSIGLKTKFCCSSHPEDESSTGYPCKYYIMFDDAVTDEAMLEFLNTSWSKAPWRVLKGKIFKWYRMLAERGIASNWVYELSQVTHEETVLNARNDLNFLITAHSDVEKETDHE